MNVLIGTNTCVAGSGIDRVALLQALELHHQGHIVKIVTFKKGASVPTAIQVVEMPHSNSLFVERVRRLFPVYGFRTLNRLRKLIAWSDIVYAHQYPMTRLGRLAQQQGKQFIAINHGIASSRNFRAWHHKLYVRWMQRKYIQTARHAQAVWSVSRSLADEWKRFTGQESQVYRPEVQWVKMIPTRTPVEAQTYLGEKNPFFLFVGRISPHKGIHTLLAVARQLHATHPYVTFKIVGAVADEAYFRQLMEMDAPGVSFSGYVPDDRLGLLYQACTGFVTGTEWEGWDLPIVEALYFKRPVVCFNIPAHQEFIDPLVHLVPIQDVSTFTRTCQKLLP